MPVSVKTAPPVEPVTLEEARSHLRLVARGSPASHPDDDTIESAIQAAREHAESFMWRSIVETEFEWRFDDFPANSSTALVLPRNPALSVSSISYKDSDGADQAFTDYTLSLGDARSFIVPDYNESWPEARGHTNDVTVTFKAGYAMEPGSPDDYRANVPAAIKRAILFLVGHMYENRESVTVGAQAMKVPQTFENLLWPHRVRDV